MKIVVHDFAGHPGQLQLSRELARRGYIVEHHYCQSIMTGQGATILQTSDPASFSIHGISLKGEFARYSPVRRILQELKYGSMSARRLLAARPDVAIFANVPVLPLLIVAMVLRFRRIPYIFWWQDVYSEAVGTAARRRFGFIGGQIAWLVDRVECFIARNASAIVPITDAFIERLEIWGIPREKVKVIPNWGALEEVPLKPRHNPWSEAHGLNDFKVVMYAGTLGLKHDPSIIVELARCAPDDCRVVVVSQGKGRKWLETTCLDAKKLILLDYQPYEQLPDMLATADAFLVLLEADASRYSVPSKVLNYLCAGRPVLAVLPSENSAAIMIEESEAGVVVVPGDTPGVAAAMAHLLSNAADRDRMAANGRRYAERNFDISRIGDSFETVIRNVMVRNEPLQHGFESASTGGAHGSHHTRTK